MSDQVKEKLNSNLNYAGELLEVVVENLVEGTDYKKEFKYLKKNGLTVDIYFKKDVKNQKIEIKGRDPTALRTPLPETFDGKMEESDGTDNSNDRILEENDDEDPFGVAEDVDAPLVEAEPFSVSVSAKKVPDQDRINLALTIGRIIRGFIYFMIIFCGILLFSQFAIPQSFQAHYFKFWMLVKFVIRAGLINVNFGYLLTRVFDKIFGIELALMFNIIEDDSLYRFESGKISNYNVSPLIINAAPIGIILYLVRFLLTLDNSFC